MGDMGVTLQHHDGVAARRGAEHLHGRDIDAALDLCRSCNPVSPNYGEVVRFLNRLDAQAAAAEAAALEQELRRMDAEQLRERTQQEAAAEAKTLKQTKADSYEKKGKSLGEWLFGL